MIQNVVISVESLSKSYRLGAISTGTFYGDLKRWWARRRGLPDPYLKIDDVDYGNREGDQIWALRDVDFKVSQGEALGIIGRNGAGKSTLLKILTQVTAPTLGEIKVKGRIASLLEVGTGFHPELTGRENIFLNGAILGMSRMEVSWKLDEIIDFSGVEKFIDTPVKRYSSGMYVRLAFAVAAHLESDILVVDEVLAVGDAEFQKKCLGKMSDVTSKGRTVLFVSHNMGAIGAFCQKAILLDKGKLQIMGKPADVIGRYLMSEDANFPEADLYSHPNRRAGMKPVISRLAILNENNAKSKIFDIGETICFDVSLRSNDSEYRKPTLSIAIINSLGEQIIKLATWAQAPEWNRVTDQTYVRCLWQNCRLAPGKYYLNVGFSNGNEVIDYIEQPMSFEITPQTDEFPNGKIPPGVFLPKVEWDIDNR